MVYGIVAGVCLGVLALARLVLLHRSLRRQHAALAHDEAWFRTLTAGVHDVITVLDAEGRFAYQSPSLERVTGWREEELAGREPWELIHPDDRRRIQEAFARARAGESEPDMLEFRFRVKDGAYCVLEAATRNLLDDPRIRGVVVTARDVTERKRTDERFRTVFDHAPGAIAIIGDDGRIIRPNPAYVRMTGYSESELVGRSYMDLIFAEDRAAAAAAWGDLFRSRRIHAQEWRLRRRDGSEIRVLSSVAAVFDSAGGPATVIAQFSQSRL